MVTEYSRMILASLEHKTRTLGCTSPYCAYATWIDRGQKMDTVVLGQDNKYYV
mgnify:CR=1 FL=1